MACRDWEFSAGVQHEVAPRVGLDVSYFRRWYGNFTVTDNEAVGAGDFAPFTVVAPTRTCLAPRLTELDLRFSKLVRFGGTRTAVNFDIYNVLNGNAVRSLSSSYPSWQRPTNILDARLFKISAQFDF